MTKLEAQAKLTQACELIFEVESLMNIQLSATRRLGYQARIAIQSFKSEIKQAKVEEVKDIL